MTGLSPDAALFAIWVAFLVIGVLTGSGVLLWGIRSGQFGDQERARSLPLDSCAPSSTGEE